MFILPLQSKLPFKRVKEAVAKLSCIYPESVSEDSLLLVSNGKNCLVYVFKGVPEDKVFVIPELYIRNHSKVKNGSVLLKGPDYNLKVTLKNGFVTDSVVDVSGNEDTCREVIDSFRGAGRKDRGKTYSRKDGRRVLLKYSVCFFVLFSAVLFLFRLYNARQISEQRRIYALSESERKNQEELLKKQKKAEALEEQYEKLTKDKPVKVKDALSVISGCLDEGCAVRSIAVDGFMFSLEISGSDSLKVYENFEKNVLVENVSLSRLGYENGREVSSFSGVLSHSSGNTDTQGMSPDEKISFYEGLIEGFENGTDRQSPSGYSLSIKNHLAESGCTLQTLSRRESSESSPLEVSFTCTSSSLIDFLDGVQNGENAVDISSFRLKNTDGFLLCTAVFDMPRSVEIEKEKSRSTGTDEKINSMFSQKSQRSPEALYSPVNMPVYSFVGKGKSNGVPFILIKGTDGKIVRLGLSENAAEEGTYAEIETGYKANFNGQIFEVKL